VIGAGGQLGTAFRRLLLDDALPISRDELDLSNPDLIVTKLSALQPNAIINCAAYTKVDQAEKEEEVAHRINSEAVAVMAGWAANNQRPFLTFSTDYVFSGDAASPYVESSIPDPINAYGRSKLDGERAALAAGGLVVRTSWLISGSHPNFVATIMRSGKDRTLRVVSDQHGCPTVSSDLAAASLKALQSGINGLLHITNRGATTWYELARASLTEAGMNPSVVTPCATIDYPTEARRPQYSILASERLESEGVTAPPHWRQSLPTVVAEIKTWI
jgi:dTDP-4-dehydrorhamnose reductase